MTINLDNIDYDSLSALQDVDAGGQTKTTTIGTPESIDFSSLGEFKAAPASGFIKTTVFEAMKENPDAAAKQRQLSKDTGVPLFAVPGAERDLENTLKLDQIDFESLQKNSPATADMLSNYDDAVVIHDEIGGMEKAEAAIKAVRDWGSHTAKSFQHGKDVVSMSEVGINRMWAQLGVGDPVSDDDLEQLRQLEANAARDPGADYGFITGAIPTASEQLPIMWEILKGGLAGGGTGAAVAGGAGLAAGAVTGPGALATGTAGAIFGGKWGSRAGIAKQSFDLEAGLAFNEFSAMTDDLAYIGDGLDPAFQELLKTDGGVLIDQDLAAAGALTVGAINAFLEFASFYALGRTVTPAMRILIRNKVKQALLTETGKDAMKMLAGRYAVAVASEGATEFLQEMSNVIGGEFLKLADDNAFTEQTVSEAFDNFVDQLPRMLEAGGKGLQAATVFAGVGTTVSGVVEYRTRMSELAVDKGQQLDAINDSLSELKLKERSNETFKQFVQKADGDNNTTVFIDGAQAALYLQTKTGAEIAADPALTLLVKQVNEASLTGTEVQVPVADFAADIAGTDHYTVLREHMTLDPELSTPFRAEGEQVQLEQYLKSLMAEAQANSSQYVQAQEIYNTVRDQIVDTGQVDPRYASSMAELVPAYFTSLSQRTGKSLETLYRDHGFIVEGPQTGVMDEFKIPEISPEEVQARSVPNQDRRTQVTSTDTERRQNDRRVDADRRAKVDAMSPEERYDLIYRNELTGINNRRAFEEDRGKYPFVASIDADSLKTVNDSLGQDAGDALLKTIAGALHEVSGGRAYHISGDEFYVAGASQEELQAVMEKVQSQLQDKVIRSEKGVLTGPRLTYGIGQDKATADSAMKQSKLDREAAGDRAARGEMPSNMDLRNEEVVDDFYSALVAAKNANTNGAAVNVWPKEDYTKMDLFLYDEGKAGFALTRQGDMVSVFKHPDSTMKNALATIVPEAIRQGARSLDAFEGFLTEQYAKYGFVEVGRAEFDPAIAPAGWNTETMGTPDVVFMELKNEQQTTGAAQADSIQKPDRVRRGTRLLEQSSRQDTGNGREADGSLRGLPRDIPGYTPRHNKVIEKVARKYMQSVGLPYNPPNTYVPVNVARAERIADAFEQMKHDPKNPEVAAAYRALIDETVAQYKAILATGFKAEFITETNENGELIDPYDNSPRMAIDDINDNNHMWVFSTKDGFGTNDTFDPVDNPLLEETEFTDSNGTPMLANDLFRVVHDYFGHAKEGVGFRAGGEENAWRAHWSMYSPLARKAATTETRGQNSWLNYGPYGEKNRTAKTADTAFADQKIGLLPDWVVNDGATDEVFYQKADVPRTLGLYSGALLSVLNLNLQQWKPNKQLLKSAKGKIEALKEKRLALRKELYDLDKEFRNGLDELEQTPGVSPRDIKDYIDNSFDGADLERQIVDIDRDIRELLNAVEGSPSARGQDIWNKIKSEGLKKEELQYLGLEEFLTTDPEAKFTREDVAHFINQNGVNVVELKAEGDEETIDDFEWTETIDDDPDNWQYRIDDMLHEFNSLDGFSQIDEDLYWLDRDELIKKIESWMDEHPDDTGVKEYRESAARLKDAQERALKLEQQKYSDTLLPSDFEERTQMEADFGLDEWIRRIADLEAEIEEARDSLYMDIAKSDVDGVYEWVQERADELAKSEYMDTPYVTYDAPGIEGYEVQIAGNDDIGYTGYLDGRNLDWGYVYSFHEAQIQMMDALRNEGIALSDSATKWEERVMTGSYGNYRELKLTLPDIPGDFYETAHFPERNIVAFLRVDDRELSTGEIDAVAQAETEQRVSIIKDEYDELHSQLEDSYDKHFAEVVAYQKEHPEKLANYSEEAATDLMRDHHNWESLMPSDWTNEHRVLVDRVANAKYRLDFISKAEDWIKTANTYFIDEFQSDWHDKGRQDGYRQSDQYYDDLGQKVAEINDQIRETKEQAVAEFEALVPPGLVNKVKVLVMTGSEHYTGITRETLDPNQQRLLDEIVKSDEFVTFERTVNELASQGNKLQRERETKHNTAPDAPFKGDGWIALGLKRALVDAAENGFDAIAWPNNAVLKDRWSAHYDYSAQYDRKMPSIIKKLTGEVPVQIDNSTGREAQIDPAQKGYDVIFYKPYATREEVLEQIGDDPMLVNQDGSLRDVIEIVQLSDGRWNAIDKNSIAQSEGYWIVKITPEMRDAITEKGFSLFQETKGYYDPEQSIIRLTEAADLSTFLHEFAHFMLENEYRMNGQFLGDINSWVTRQADAVAKEAGVESTDVTAYAQFKTAGDSAKDAAIRRAIHEQFARAWEQYLMEGKAPSMELRNAFRAFARWLTQLYQRLTGKLNQNLDDEMRKVFDRLIATEEQIEIAAARETLAPLFTDATMAGMTEEEFQKYKEKTAKIKDHAAETMRDKLIKEITRTQEQWWRQEKAEVSDDEKDRLREQPIYKAIDRLKHGDIKLDHATVKEMVGQTREDKRGRVSIVIPPKLTGMTAKGQQGVHPDDAAAFFGFASGEEMINEVLAAPTLQEAAESAAEQIMIQRHGDIMNDGTIDRLAEEALQNEEKAELMLAEIRALRRGTQAPNVDRQVLKQLAEDRIAQLAYREIFPEKYFRAEVRAAQEAAEMLTKGNKEGAAAAKTRQLINHFLAREANKAKTEVLSIVDFMSRYNRKPVRERIMKAENGYMEQLDKILHRFEFRKSKSMKSVDRVNEGLKEWMDKRIKEHGDTLVLAPAVLDEGYVTHWKNIKFDDLKGIRDSVKNIEHVARYIDKIKVLQEKRDFKALVNDIVEHLAKQPVVHKAQRTDIVDGRKFGRWAMAQMSKMPWVVSWLDGGERTGLMHDILMTPMNDAYDQELRLWREIGKPVLSLIENRSNDDRKRHNKKLYIPELKTDSQNGVLYGHQVIAVALNTGNAGNLRKMLLGEGWANPDNEAEISIDNPKLQAVLTHMTEADWDLVQGIWDQMEILYPMLADVHRKTTGLVPPKVEAISVPTPFGEYRGGYYPVKYDPNRSFRAEQNEDRLTAETESMFSGGASLQAQVNTGATEARTGYFAPIRLSLDVVPSHFQETIHYIAFHDAVRQTNKLIRNQQVAEAIKRVIGPEEFAQFKPWLNDIAKDGREAPTKTFIDKALQRLRFGVTLGVMGFKASTGLMQLLGLSNTVGEVGTKHAYKAFKMVLGSPESIQEAWQFAVENSKVMNHRVQTMDREIRSAMKKIEGKHGILPAVQEASMKHIALIQTYMVDLPTWYAAYSKGMEEWGDEARAFRYADWAVENLQGSGATKDMAALMRNQTETHRIFTMFMTFFSSLWNMERDLVRGGRSGRYSVTTVAAKAMWFFVVPVLLESLMRGQLGDEDDDQELQKLLLMTATYPVQSVPFVRDVANGVFSDYPYNMSPIASLLEQGTRTIPEIATRGFTDDDITKAQWKGGSKFIGAATGIPGINQAWATGEHLYEVIEEGEDLSVRGLIYGPKR